MIICWLSNSDKGPGQVNILGIAEEIGSSTSATGIMLYAHAVPTNFHQPSQYGKLFVTVTKHKYSIYLITSEILLITSKVSSNCLHLNQKILYQHHVAAKLPLPNTTSSPKERHLLSVVPSVAPPTGAKRGGGGESFSIHGSTRVNIGTVLIMITNFGELRC